MCLLKIKTIMTGYTEKREDGQLASLHCFDCIGTIQCKIVISCWWCILLSNTWFHTCQYVQVNWDGTTKGSIMCLWYLSRSVAFVIDILVIFPVPVIIVFLRAKMSSFVSSLATFRFTRYNKQPHGFCNHLKTNTLVLGIQDVLQRKRVEIC